MLGAPAGKVDVPRLAEQVAGGVVGLVGVGGDDEFPAEEVPHHTHVVDALVGLAVLAHVQPDVGGDQFQVGLVDSSEALMVVGLVDTEDAEICEQAHHPRYRGSSGNGCGVVLLDPSLEEVLGC